MPAESKTETWVVAAEYDTAALKRLGLVLESLGYVFEKRLSGVAGSQELTTWRAYSPYGSLSIEAETYVGLSVRGAPQLIATLRCRWAEAVRSA